MKNAMQRQMTPLWLTSSLVKKDSFQKQLRNATGSLKTLTLLSSAVLASFLLNKTPQFSREEVTKKTNILVGQLKVKGLPVGVQECNSIHIHTGGQRRDKYLQCYACGCGSCFDCFELAHQGKCIQKSIHPLLALKQGAQIGDNFQDFLSVNQMKRCLNAKCGLPIAKEEGCYWVKCRCSWQMCYPCGKLWGDCEHFSKYPYQKFVPPADWLVKVLKLY